MRLNSDHFETIVSFAEKHPQVITNKWNGINGKQTSHNIWQTLANKLNALGYGILTVTEYKRRLTDWKSKVKAKGCAVRKSRAQTGGGEGIPTVVTKIEDRLLALMEDKACNGDEVEEMGISLKSSTHENGQRHLSNITSCAAQAKVVKPTETALESYNCIDYEEASTSSQNMCMETIQDHNYASDNDYMDTNTKETPENVAYNKPLVSTKRRRRLNDLAESIQDMNSETITV